MAGQESDWDLAGVRRYSDDDPRTRRGSIDTLGSEDEPSHENKEAEARGMLICLNIMLFLLGGTLCGLGYYVGFLAQGGAWIAYVAAGLGLAIVLMSCCGLCGASARSHRTILLYYTFTLLMSMVALVVGGFCFILTDSAVDVVKDNWNEIAAEDESLSVDDFQAHADAVRTNLMIVGGAALLVMLVLLCAMRQVVQYVSSVRAYTLMLQASTLTTLPFGIILIAGALFVADTAASADSPVTAFGIFVMGAFVIALSLLGCFGVAIGSRGLIKLFAALIFVVMLAFFAFGILSFVQAETIQDQIVSNWDTIRRVLPPTFSGKYDREQFTKFLEANLQAVGFLSLCMGVLMAAQVYASMRLQSAMKRAAQEAKEEDYGEGGENIARIALANKNKRSRLQRRWKAAWTHGSTKTRCAIRCCCCCVCCLLFAIIGLSVLALYFSTSCSQLAEFSDSTTYSQGTATVMKVELFNNYSRGVSQVVLDATQTQGMSLKFERSALRQGFATGEVPTASLINNSTMTLTADPKAPTRVLGFDISCQLSTISAVMPTKAYFGGDDSYAASLDGFTVVMDTRSDFAGAEVSLDKKTSPRLRYVNLKTTKGPITVENAKLGAEGLTMESETGEIFVSNVNVQCNPLLMGVSGALVQAKSVLGGIRVQQTEFRDCEITGTGGAALVSFEDVIATTAQGNGASIALEGEKGLIELTNVTADELLLTSNLGGIRGTTVFAKESLKASTISGAIGFTDVDMALRASIQIETTSGSVKVVCKRFAGFVSLHTSGVITVDTTKSHWNSVQKDTFEGMHTVTANVNCEGQGNCPYLGEILISSSTGGITLEVAAWDQTRPALQQQGTTRR